MTETAASINPALLADAMQRVEGPHWLADQRQAALRRFQESGLPGPRDEDWRYTRLDYLARQPLHTPLDQPAPPLPIEAYPGILMAFLDNQLIWHDSRLPPDQLADLADAPASIRDRLGSLAGDSSLVMLNDALWREGALLQVPARERLRQPVFLRFAASQADTMLHPRVLVLMEPDSDAILVEHFHADTQAPHWQNSVTEVVLEAGARLTHIRLVENGNASHTHLAAVHQERDSQYRALTLTLGGRVVRHDLRVSLAGIGAEARLDGLFIADGRRHADHHLLIGHDAPRTRSRMLWRGLAADRGRGIFDARVVIGHEARQAEAHQSSRNLLLSPHAEIDARPHLEIYTDDVKCGHGATVGRLDEAALFYLTSRGIDAATAREMLLAAFAGEALALADAAGLRGWLQGRIDAHLPGLTLEAARS